MPTLRELQERIEELQEAKVCEKCGAHNCPCPEGECTCDAVEEAAEENTKESIDEDVSKALKQLSILTEGK